MPNRAIQGNVAMQVAQSDGQLGKQCKWRQLMTKLYHFGTQFATDARGAFWWRHHGQMCTVLLVSCPQDDLFRKAINPRNGTKLWIFSARGVGEGSTPFHSLLGCFSHYKADFSTSNFLSTTNLTTKRQILAQNNQFNNIKHPPKGSHKKTRKKRSG